MFNFVRLHIIINMHTMQAATLHIMVLEVFHATTTTFMSLRYFVSERNCDCLT